MTTENSFNKLTHPQSSEVKLKNLHGTAEILQEIFKCITERNLDELVHLLEGSGLIEKSLNITLTKAFGVYRPNSKESKDIIRALLNHKADPNINVEAHFKNAHPLPEKKGSKNMITGLMFAASENDVYLANVLISHHCNVNLKDNNNRNALFYAILYAKEADISEMVNVLLSAGIHVNEVDIEGNSALTLAVIKGMKEVIKVLLDHGADVDHQVAKDGNTALHYAVSNNKLDIIPLLLTRMMNLNARNKQDQTPMEIATSLSRTEVYQILAEEYNQRELGNKRKEELMAMNAMTLNNNNDTTSRSSNENFVEEHKFKEDEEVLLRNNGLSNQGNIQNMQMQNMQNLQNMNYNYNNYQNINQMNKMNIHQMNQFQGNPNITGSNIPYKNMNMNNSNMVSNLLPNSMIMGNNNMNRNVPGNNSNNMPFAHKYTKSAKLQKLNYLQERRQYAEQTGRSIKDKAFKFPFGQSNQSTTNIEIPFNFQTNSEGKLANNQNRYGKGSQLHTFIKIQSTPVLHIDISDETKQDQFILSSQLEELRITNAQLLKRINQLEIEVYNASDENSLVKAEIEKQKQELTNKDKIINGLKIELNNKEVEYTNNLDTIQVKLEEKNAELQNLHGKYEVLEKEFLEMKSSEGTYKNYMDSKGNKSNQELVKKEFLEKKFSCSKYDEKYIIKCLQRDILDFQEYTKDQIKKVKSVQEELISLIQEAVDEVMQDYEVKLYGSHATNLCLQWSDLDVVLVHKRNNNPNYTALQSLYLYLLEKPWKKQIKLIDSAVVPIIKMTSTEQYNNMHIDISLQDSKHYGLKCVELVKSFMKEYEALEPLIFALKNILKNANLNDPYTGGLSSYGLILMVVSFLQSQQENKKSIKIADGNLGRMFLEFLWYYGLMFDHSKYVIYAYPTNEVSADRDSINFLYGMQPSHELIIVDPLSKSNNVARSTYQFVNIKMAFMIGFVVSHEECECGCHYNRLGDEGNVYSTDHCILKRIFNSVKRFNANTNSS